MATPTGPGHADANRMITSLRRRLLDAITEAAKWEAVAHEYAERLAAEAPKETRGTLPDTAPTGDDPDKGSHIVDTGEHRPR